jgi:hypothetical protein
VDTRLDQDETEFGVAVFAVTFQVLANGDSLLDEVVLYKYIISYYKK